MFKEKILKIFEEHQGKVIGSIIGFIISMMVLLIGFFKTLFIIGCILIGFYIGKRIDNRENISEILDRILPIGKSK